MLTEINLKFQVKGSGINLYDEEINTDLINSKKSEKLSDLCLRASRLDSGSDV